MRVWAWLQLWGLGDPALGLWGQSPGGLRQPSPLPTQPVDRDPVVCHPDLGELLQACPAELPDEFFEVTVDDVRRRLAQLRSERWVCPSCVGASWSRGARGWWVWVLLAGWPGRPPTFTRRLATPCRKRLEEAPLVTKAFREAQKREKLERYPKVRRRARGASDHAAGCGHRLIAGSHGHGS